MNIFYLDEDPVLAAQYLHDTHVVKMITESGQLLSAVTGHGYRAGRWAAHPCAKWVAHSRENALWLCDHLAAMLNEYRYRFGEDRDKFQQVRFHYDEWRRLAGELPANGRTPPALAVYEVADGMDTSDPVAVYRAYYIQKKLFNKNGKPFTWRKRGKPQWLLESLTQSNTPSDTTE